MFHSTGGEGMLGGLAAEHMEETWSQGSRSYSRRKRSIPTGEYK